MEKAQYRILCKNGVVSVKGYVIDAKPLTWVDVWNDTHYVGIHKLNDGKWGLDDLNSGLSLTSKEYETRKAARKDLEEIYLPKLYRLWASEGYKRQAWRFSEKIKEQENGKRK